MDIAGLCSPTHEPCWPCCPVYRSLTHSYDRYSNGSPSELIDLDLLLYSSGDPDKSPSLAFRLHSSQYSTGLKIECSVVQRTFRNRIDLQVSKLLIYFLLLQMSLSISRPAAVCSPWAET